MSALALSLVLTAAVLHAVWNIAAKGVRGDGQVFVWWYALVSAAVWLPVSLADPGTWTAWGWPLLLAAAVTGVLHGAYGLTLQAGYERAALGVVYPVARGVGPLLTVLVAVLLLGERPSPVALAGGLVVLAGVVIVAVGANRSRTGPPGRGRLTGLLWGAIVGAAIAAYTLWDDHAMTGLGLPAIVYFALGSAVETLLLTPAVLRRRGAIAASWRADRGRIVLVGLLSPLAYVLVLTAMRTTPVSLVAPVRESSIVIGALLGWWLFHERGILARLAGCVAVLTGIALIALG